jgi:hypothetical protein
VPESGRLEFRFKHGSASSLENAVFVDLVTYRQSVHQCKYMPVSLEQSRLAEMYVAPKERRLHVEMSRMLAEMFYLMLEWLRPYGNTNSTRNSHIESSFRRIHGQNRNRLPDMEERLRELSAIVK